MIPLPSVGQIVDLIKTGATIEAREQIMKLREGALELQEDNLRLVQEVREARDKCRQMEEHARIRAKVSFKNNVCWLEDDPQPICPICWEANKNIVHLHGPYHSDGSESYSCRLDEKTFYTRSSPSESFTMDSWENFGGRAGNL